jgi:hypothetical protein
MLRAGWVNSGAGGTSTIEISPLNLNLPNLSPTVASDAFARVDFLRSAKLRCLPVPKPTLEPIMVCHPERSEGPWLDPAKRWQRMLSHAPAKHRLYFLAVSC